MSVSPGQPAHQAAIVIHCTQCGQAMLVAREHVDVQVACPHCRVSLEPWRAAGEIAPSTASSRSPFAYGPAQQGLNGYSWRNRWVAGALGVLLGPLGVHRFYLGYVGIGITQIVVTFATAGFGGSWGFVEGVLCLTGPVMRDVDGLPLRS